MQTALVALISRGVVSQTKDLSKIIYQYKNTQFSWESFDCCIFTAKVVEEYSGKDLPKWKEVISYNNYKGAMKALRKLGCKEILDLPSIILDTPRKDISEVKRGEPVYYVNEKGQGILGVCNGMRAYFLQQGGGLTARKVEECLYCWSID